MFGRQSRGLVNPVAVREEHGRRDHDAADAVGVPGGLPSVPADASRHRVERRRAVLLAESLPGKPHGRRLVASEDPEPADGFVRGLELEEERRPGRAR